MRLAEARVMVAPGDGIVARRGGVLVAVYGRAESDAGARIVALVVGGEIADSTRLGAALDTIVQASGAESVPGYCLICDGADGIAMFRSGEVEVRAGTTGAMVLVGGSDKSGPESGRPDVLTDDLDSIEIGPAGANSAPATTATEILEGVARCGSVLIGGSDTGVSHDADADDDETIVASEAPASFEIVDLAGARDAAPAPAAPAASTAAPAESRSALPIASELVESGTLIAADVDDDGVLVDGDGVLVDGVVCRNGHFNHPQAAYCAYDGVSMLQQTRTSVRGKRPPLGILVFGDGRAFTLDATYVLGREPERDEDVRDDAARGVTLDDPDKILSRVHCRVDIDSWDVRVTDAGSANGTWVFAPGAVQWQRLAPGQPAVLAPATYVQIGGHRFIYESHHLRSY